jgi:hypothetical protein
MVGIRPVYHVRRVQPIRPRQQSGGVPIRYADAIVVVRNGMVYFSDASNRFPPAPKGHV